MLKRTLDYFSRMDARSIDGSAEDLLAGNDRMAIREVHDREDLMLKVRKSDRQILLRILHVLDDGALGDSLREDPECRIDDLRSEEHTSELQSLRHLVCRLLLEKKKHHPGLMQPANSAKITSSALRRV